MDASNSTLDGIEVGEKTDAPTQLYFTFRLMVAIFEVLKLLSLFDPLDWPDCVSAFTS